MLPSVERKKSWDVGKNSDSVEEDLKFGMESKFLNPN